MEIEDARYYTGKQKEAEMYDGILGYNTSFGAYKLSIVADSVFDICGMDSTKNVLEIAAGTGELAIKYAKKANMVVCVDISKYMVSIEKNKADGVQVNNMEFVVGDGLSLPFRDNTFDIVIERGIQLVYQDYFLSDGTTDNFVKEMRRVTKDKVIIMHQNKIVNYNKSELNRHFFTENELKKLLVNSDFNDIRTIYITHSTRFLFNVFGDMKLKKLENIIRSIPILNKIGGGIIACGKK